MKRDFPIISPRRYDQVPLAPEAFKCAPEPIRDELERKTMERVREAYAGLLAMGCVNIRVEPLPHPQVGFKLVGDKPEQKA